MSAIGDRQFVDYVCCGVCGLQQGQVWEEVTSVSNGVHFKHLTQPSPLPTICKKCGGVLVRDLSARNQPNKWPKGPYSAV